MGWGGAGVETVKNGFHPYRYGTVAAADPQPKLLCNINSEIFGGDAGKLTFGAKLLDGFVHGLP